MSLIQVDPPSIYWLVYTTMSALWGETLTDSEDYIFAHSTYIIVEFNLFVFNLSISLYLSDMPYGLSSFPIP